MQPTPVTTHEICH